MHTDDKSLMMTNETESQYTLDKYLKRVKNKY